jgi:WD40 repeat protein
LFACVAPLWTVAQIKIGSKGDKVYDFCISRDSNRLYVPINDKIEVWNTHTLSREKILFSVVKAPIISLDINNSSGYLVAGTKDSTLISWDLISGNSKVIQRQKSLITLIELSSNDSLMALVMNDRIEILDAISLTTRYILKGHTSDITKVKFMGNRKLISCSADHNIIIWDIFHEKILTKWEASNNWLRSVSVNSNQTKVVSCGDDGRIKIWDISDLKNITQLSNRKVSFAWLTTCEFYDNVSYVVSGHSRRINIFSPLIKYSTRVNTYVNKVAFIPDSKQLIVAVATFGSGLWIINGKDMRIKD